MNYFYVIQEKVFAEIVKIAISVITEFFSEDCSLKQVSETPQQSKSSGLKSVKNPDTGFSIQMNDKFKALKILIQTW